MPCTPAHPATSRREGLKATAPIYLKNVTVDSDGLIREYDIAFLEQWADPDVIKNAIRNSINLDQPERVEIYDEDERWLEGHPGNPQPTRRPWMRAAARCAWRAIRRTIEARISPGALVVINEGNVAEAVCGEVTIVDFSELTEPCYNAGELLKLADDVEREFGKNASLTVADVRKMAEQKRAHAARASA